MKNFLLYTLAIFGGLWLATIGHEFYHWFLGKPIEMCMNFQGMYVLTYKTTGEGIADIIFYILSVIFLGFVISLVIKEARKK